MSDRLRIRMVTFDLDSTLCDTRKRDRSVLKNPDTGEHEYTVQSARAYGAQCLEDEPIVQNIQLLGMLAKAGYAIGLCSSRPFSVMHLTQEWLRQNKVLYDWMRLQTDEEISLSSEAFKMKALLEAKAEGYDVVLHVDDWPPVRDGLLEIGVQTLVVQPPPEAKEPSPETEMSAHRSQGSA